MKDKYLLFGGSTGNYGDGGWFDLEGKYETVSIALNHTRAWWDWWHIVDVTTLKIVMSEEGLT